MFDGLRRLECGICGQSIYFAVPEKDEMFDGNKDAVMEVTCPRGHSDTFTHAELNTRDTSGKDISGKIETSYMVATAAF